MKITFHFENGSSEIILQPETTRDKQYISLCLDGEKSIQLKPRKDEFLVIRFESHSEGEKR